MSDNYNIQNYINGSFSVSTNTEEIKNINPSDLSIINSFKETSIEVGGNLSLLVLLLLVKKYQQDHFS